jgi:hypothetical protein
MESEVRIWSTMQDCAPCASHQHFVVHAHAQVALSGNTANHGGAPYGVNVRWQLKPASGSPTWAASCQATISTPVPMSPIALKIGQSDPLVAAYTNVSGSASTTCTAAIACGRLYIFQGQTRGGIFGGTILADSVWSSSSTIECFTGCTDFSAPSITSCKFTASTTTPSLTTRVTAGVSPGAPYGFQVAISPQAMRLMYCSSVCYPFNALS